MNNNPTRLFDYKNLQKENPYSYFPLNYYYSYPNSPYCEFPKKVSSSLEQRNIYFFHKPMNQNESYYSFMNAYPAFAYKPCYYSNTSI